MLPTRLSAVDEAGNNGRPVRRQDRHADAKRTTLSGRHGPMVIVHRSRCALGLPLSRAPKADRIQWTLAIRAAAAAKGEAANSKFVSFTPFDPAKRMSEATVTGSNGERLRVVKGAFATVSGLADLAIGGS